VNKWFQSYLANRTQFIETFQIDKNKHPIQTSILTEDNYTWNTTGLNSGAPFIIMPIFRRTRRVLLHVVCCAVTSEEKVDISCKDITANIYLFPACYSTAHHMQ